MSKGTEEENLSRPLKPFGKKGMDSYARIKRNRKLRTMLPVVALLLIGLCLIAYPMVGNWLYDQSSSQVVASYDESVSSMTNDEINRQFELANEYNESLRTASVILTDPFDPTQTGESVEPYDSIMNMAGDGIIGHISIPKIDVNLPIYHGTSAETLEKGIGHMSNTSFPTGEKGTHAVLTGHTGMTHARMFTDVSQLEIGDVFYISVLDRTFAYKVNQIDIVEPSDSSLLQIVDDKEYVTLLTCYPYGVNSHRLLVRGEGIPLEEAQEINQDQVVSSVWDSQYYRAIILCLMVYAPLTIGAILFLRHKNKKTSLRAL